MFDAMVPGGWESPVSRRHALRGLFGTSALLLAAACTPTPASAPAGTTAPAAARPSLAKIRVLYNVPADPTFVPDLSAFKDLKSSRGIDTDVQEITGADASIKALVAGQAEFALSSLASGMLAVGQSQKIRAVVPSSSAPYFSLMVPASVNTWQDLAGKSIGITATSDASYYTTLLQLKKYGVDPNSINWVTVRGSAARVDAMRAGKLDCSQVTVGQVLDMADDPRFKRFADVGKDFPNLLFSAYWVNENLITDHPDVIQTFAEAVMQQHRVAQDKTKWLAEAKSDLPDVDANTLPPAYDILKDMHIWDPNESGWANDTGGEFTSRTMADFQAVESYTPFTDWATTRFVDAARQKLGQFSA